MASRFKHESPGFAPPKACGPRQGRVYGLLLVVGCVAAVTGCKTFGRPQHNTAQQAMLDANCPPTITFP